MASVIANIVDTISIIMCASFANPRPFHIVIITSHSGTRA